MPHPESPGGMTYEYLLKLLNMEHVFEQCIIVTTIYNIFVYLVIVNKYTFVSIVT